MRRGDSLPLIIRKGYYGIDRMVHIPKGTCITNYYFEHGDIENSLD